ncbi:hypothetical protein L9F63_019383, partial [Diploptera punctata]
ARNHGVGYYSFSQDEDIRKSQQEALNKLRQQTQKVQEATKDARERRKQQMEARLKAARRRKRERMGLPPEDEQQEPEVNEEADEEEEEAKPVEKPKSLQNPTTTKPPKVRPWDIGKEGVKQVMSQEDWVEKKRKERVDEFAPPSSYRPDFIPSSDPQVKSKPTLFFSSKKPKSARDSVKRQMEISSCDDLEAAGSSTETRGRGTEVPPPATFEYYGPTSTAVKKNYTKGGDLESAIDAGLKFLRQQTEEKQKMREKGLLDIV